MKSLYRLFIDLTSEDVISFNWTEKLKRWSQRLRVYDLNRRKLSFEFNLTELVENISSFVLVTEDIVIVWLSQQMMRSSKLFGYVMSTECQKNACARVAFFEWKIYDLMICASHTMRTMIKYTNWCVCGSPALTLSAFKILTVVMETSTTCFDIICRINVTSTRFFPLVEKEIRCIMT